MSHRQQNPLPKGPDDLFGLREGDKGWIGLLFSLLVLAVLIWAIFTAMHAHLPVL